MSLHLSRFILDEIQAHGAQSYPDEGAGFLLGRASGEQRSGVQIYAAPNVREQAARARRYLLEPQEMLKAEQAAAAAGLDVIGIFHSHPDHPSQPSEFDREWALPWFSYLITKIEKSVAIETRSWRLSDDRSQFSEEAIIIEEN
jgi:proteasome lid subunit RPN8/RPN11